MAQDFSDAMAKLAILGQDPSNLIDCSEVIPQPEPLPTAYRRSVFPPGFTNADVDDSVLFPFVCVKCHSDHFCVSVSVPPFHTFQQFRVQSCLFLLYEQGSKALPRAVGSVISFTLRRHCNALMTSHIFWRYAGQQVGYRIGSNSNPYPVFIPRWCLVELS
jgi:hypothetical protein